MARAMNFDKWLAHIVETGRIPPGPRPEPAFFSRGAEGEMQRVAGIDPPHIPLEKRIRDLADLSDV